MYGEIMLSPFPLGKIKQSSNMDLNKPGFSYVVVKSNSQLPVLPHKWEVYENNYKSENLIFSNGIFEGLYPHEELRFFIEKGDNSILESRVSWEFSGEEEFLFKAFAEEIKELREIGDRSIWKSIFVSLFGKLGMSPIDSETLFLTNAEYLKKKETIEILKEIWFQQQCLVQIKKTPENPNSMVQYAALITAKARIKLYKAIEDVEKAGGRLLYCDTDSLFVAFPSKMEILGKQHGEVYWNPTKKNVELADACFASTRTYSVLFLDGSWETKMAGQPRNSISFQHFKEEFYTCKSSFMNSYKRGSFYEYENFPLNNEFPNIFNYREWNVKNYINLHNYKKRGFTKDKKQTFPWYKIDDEYLKKPY